jgi:gliding motility-associated-like protein
LLSILLYYTKLTMTKIFLSLFFMATSYVAFSQGTTSYTCRRDTLVPCEAAFINLQAQLPDLAKVASGANYIVMKTSGLGTRNCYLETSNIEAPGTPTGFFQDDTYSQPIALGFNFPFYGVVHNNLVISTNGYISFDVSKAGAFSHFSVNSNLPSTSYDGDVIMGAYHDIDPSETTSPNMRIDYTVIGVAPTRKFVFSFYKVPLFSCANLIENTQQIILHEGTGLIDVKIYSKQICTGWQGGRAIIGLQNVDKTQGIMAPGRGFSDGQWGNVNMNESWRFIPYNGNATNSAFKSVRLLDFAGNVIANGTATRGATGFLDVNFANVLTPNQISNFIIESRFEKFDDPTIEIIGRDTVIVSKTLPSFNAAATTVAPKCNGANTGEIRFTEPLGASYEYSINNGATYTSNPIFTGLTAGTYNLSTRAIGNSVCARALTVTITQPTVATLDSVKLINPNCSNNNGQITLHVSGATPKYLYAIDTSAFQADSIFNNLRAATYGQFKIKDSNNCVFNFTRTERLTLIDTMRLRLPADTNVCFGKSVVLVPSTNPETTIFNWLPGRPLLNNDTIATPIATVTDTTKFTLTAKWGVCTRADSMFVKILQKPIPNAGLDTIVCFKTPAILRGSAISRSGPVGFTWAPSNMVNPNNIAVTTAYPDTTRFFVLTVSDKFGCNFNEVDSVLVTMRDPVNAFAGNDTIAKLNQPHQLAASGGVLFNWHPSYPLNNPFSATPLATLSSDQFFTVTVTDDIGCVGTDGVFVRAIKGPDYYLPNAFTPNGDGLNDIFRPIPSGIRNTEYFRVFDRYGNLMFETRQNMRGWNGQLNGTPASPGTYTYMIKGFDDAGNVIAKTGTVVLIR